MKTKGDEISVAELWEEIYYLKEIIHNQRDSVEEARREVIRREEVINRLKGELFMRGTYIKDF